MTRFLPIGVVCEIFPGAWSLVNQHLCLSSDRVQQDYGYFLDNVTADLETVDPADLGFPQVPKASFEDPVHRCDAIEVTATRSFSGSWSLFASYRWSRLRGSYEEWPEQRAMGLWLAPVAPREASMTRGSEQPLAALNVWMPDGAYARYIRHKGDYATQGAVTLHRDKAGRWRGTITTEGLEVVADCAPGGSVEGGPDSFGRQFCCPPDPPIPRVWFASPTPATAFRNATNAHPGS